MNADCVARSPVITLQGHPALGSTIEKKPATNTCITHSFKRPIQESHQHTTIHNSLTGNLNHLQGKGDLETTSNTQANYIKPISIAAGFVI